MQDYFFVFLKTLPLRKCWNCRKLELHTQHNLTRGYSNLNEIFLIKTNLMAGQNELSKSWLAQHNKKSCPVWLLLNSCNVAGAPNMHTGDPDQWNHVQSIYITTSLKRKLQFGTHNTTKMRPSWCGRAGRARLCCGRAGRARLCKYFNKNKGTTSTSASFKNDAAQIAAHPPPSPRTGEVKESSLQEALSHTPSYAKPNKSGLLGSVPVIAATEDLLGQAVELNHLPGEPRLEHPETAQRWGALLQGYNQEISYCQTSHFSTLKKGPWFVPRSISV